MLTPPNVPPIQCIAVFAVCVPNPGRRICVRVWTADTLSHAPAPDSPQCRLHGAGGHRDHCQCGARTWWALLYRYCQFSVAAPDTADSYFYFASIANVNLHPTPLILTWQILILYSIHVLSWCSLQSLRFLPAYFSLKELLSIWTVKVWAIPRITDSKVRFESRFFTFRMIRWS